LQQAHAHCEFTWQVANQPRDVESASHELRSQKQPVQKQIPCS